MAKKDGTNGRATGKNAGNKWGVRWVNYDLTSEDKERLANSELRSQLEQFNPEDLVVEGFKYSCGVDEKNSCFIASLTDKREGTLFHNHCLTGRGATPSAARVSLLYRHLVLAEGDWAFFSTPNGSEDQIFF